MTFIEPTDENTLKESNKLVIIGNGFDLAHGLRTSYKNFLDWYMCKAFQEFCEKKYYSDSLIEIKNKYSGTTTIYNWRPNSIEEVIKLIDSKQNPLTQNQFLIYKSEFLEGLIKTFEANNWIDIEFEYFRLLKTYFTNSNPKERKLFANLIKNSTI